MGHTVAIAAKENVVILMIDTGENELLELAFTPEDARNLAASIMDGVNVASGGVEPYQRTAEREEARPRPSKCGWSKCPERAAYAVKGENGREYLSCEAHLKDTSRVVKATGDIRTLL